MSELEINTQLDLDINEVEVSLENKEENITCSLDSDTIKFSMHLENEALRGYSAYEVWLENGNEGTIDDYFESLKGVQGNNGETPYVGENGNWWIGNTDTQCLAYADMDEISNEELEDLFAEINW